MASTTVLPVLLPETIGQPDTGYNDRGIHWVCVQILEHPFVSLCGELTDGRREATDHICERCTGLAVGHLATCIPCAWWVAVLL